MPLGSRTEPQYSLFAPQPDGAIEPDEFAIEVGILGDVPDQRGVLGRRHASAGH